MEVVGSCRPEKPFFFPSPSICVVDKQPCLTPHAMCTQPCRWCQEPVLPSTLSCASFRLREHLLGLLAWQAAKAEEAGVAGFGGSTTGVAGAVQPPQYVQYGHVAAQWWVAGSWLLSMLAYDRASA